MIKKESLIFLFIFLQSPIILSKEKEVLVQGVDEALSVKEKEQGSIRFVQGEVSNEEAALYIRRNLNLFSRGYEAPTKELKEIEKIALEKIYNRKKNFE